MGGAEIIIWQNQQTIPATHLTYPKNQRGLHFHKLQIGDGFLMLVHLIPDLSHESTDKMP